MRVDTTSKMPESIVLRRVLDTLYSLRVEEREPKISYRKLGGRNYTAGHIGQLLMIARHDGIAESRGSADRGQWDFTSKGLGVVQEWVRLHRLLEVLLYRCEVKWGIVYERATIGLPGFNIRGVAKQLRVLLGDPELCPHGNEVWVTDHTPRASWHQELGVLDLKEGEGFRVKRVAEWAVARAVLPKNMDKYGLQVGRTGALVRVDGGKAKVFLAGDKGVLEMPARWTEGIVVERL